MSDVFDAKRRRWVQGALGIAGAGALGVPGSVIAQSTRGIVGRAAPELTIDDWSDRDGKPTTFSVAESRGKWVFLKCFQSWCPGCHSSGFPTLAAVQNALGERDGLAIAAVQTVFEGFRTNTSDKIPEIRERYGLSVPIGHDAGDADAEHGDIERMPSTMLNYRTGGTPWLILIDPAGQVVFNDFHADRERLIAYLDEQLG